MKEERLIRKVEPLKEWPPPPEAPEAPRQKDRGWLYSCGGMFAGGCLIPLLLFFICVAAGDTGGPGFWLIISLLLAVIGLFAGIGIHDIRSARKR